jgi:hypothetical protein
VIIYRLRRKASPEAEFWTTDDAPAQQGLQKIQIRRTSVHICRGQTENRAATGFQTVAGREFGGFLLNGRELSAFAVILMVKLPGSMIIAFY